MAPRAYKNTSMVREVRFRGRPLPDRFLQNIVSVELDMSMEQVAELTIGIDDPKFAMLKTNLLKLETDVTFRGLKLNIAVIETSAGGGQGGVVIRCRPKAVNKLKKLRGAFVMKNVSPATYVRAECKKAGITRVVAQESGKKSEISRDLEQKGDSYDEASKPSAWTTMQRLANELGYVMYESGGVLYFGKPSWLVKKQPKVEVRWYPENGKEPYTFPEFRQSIDNEDIELSLELPIERAGSVFPGAGIKVTGFPKYSGTYLIKSVNYPLVGVGNIAISASTIRDPDPQEGGDEGRDEDEE